MDKAGDILTPAEQAAWERNRDRGARDVERLTTAERWSVWAHETYATDLHDVMHGTSTVPPGWWTGIVQAVQAWVEAGAPDGAAYGLDGA